MCVRARMCARISRHYNKHIADRYTDKNSFCGVTIPIPVPILYSSDSPFKVPRKLLNFKSQGYNKVGMCRIVNFPDNLALFATE